MAKERRTCRVCESPELVGYWGLCQEDQDAVDSFIARRRSNTIGEGKKEKDEWSRKQELRQKTGGRV